MTTPNTQPPHVVTDTIPCEECGGHGFPLRAPDKPLACERCGSARIDVVEDRDDSVGYSENTLRCLDCLAEIELPELIADGPDSFDLLGSLSLEEQLVGSIAIAQYRREARRG